MTPLLVVVPTHPGDVDRAETLLRWIASLGNVERHSLMLAVDGELPQERVKALLDIVRGEFHTVRAIIVQTGVRGWPLASNLMFRAVARQIESGYTTDFLLLEPDAVPLRASWLNDIAEEYELCPRPFMGCLMNNETPGEGLPDRYMSGVAVWPRDTYSRLETLWADARFTGPTKPNTKLSLEARTKGVRAWDMVAAPQIVPFAQHTALIQNMWGTAYDTPPLFVTARTEADPPNAVTLDLVRRDAVVFHRVKDVEGFLAMWRIRLLVEDPAIATPGGVVPLAGHLPEAQPGEANPNWRGGSSPDADKARRAAKAQESRDYLAESRRIAAERRSKAQEAATAKLKEPASV